MRQASSPIAPILLAAAVLPIGAVGGISGCASGIQPPRLIHEGPRVSVTLHTLPPGTLRATHPATLSEATLALVLGGVRVRTEQRLMQSLLAGDATPQPAFEAEIVEALTRTISRALAEAGADDYVRFQARQDGERGEELTEGVLYLRDGAVVLAFTDVGVRPGPGPPKGKSGGRAPLSPVGPQLSIAFEPRGVEVPLDSPPPSGLASFSYRPLAIDYRLLVKLTGLDEGATQPGRPDESTRPTDTVPAPTSGAVHQAPEADVEALKDLVIQKDLEIEALRREVEALRNRLSSPGAREPD